ncbi:MAG TPA: O-antigen ligase family protein [Ktedonobacteraceae bacterium]|nr:O-antigen ligase family protein [Ktedonobacteraceae bacterium]
MLKSGIFGQRIAIKRAVALLPLSSMLPLLPVVIAGLSGLVLGTKDESTTAFIAGTLLFLLALALRRYELAVVMIVAAHIYIDWFLGLQIVASVVSVGLLFFLFCIRSPRHPWRSPRALWLWGLFLVLTLPPALRGAQSRSDFSFYYINDIFGALVMFWLGLVVVTDKMCLRILFKLLTIFGVLLAIHTIIQARTGIVIFDTSRFDAYLAQLSDFQLASATIHRAGSFLQNPDWNGTFFAIMLFLPLGLLVETRSFLEKIGCFLAMLLMAIALLCTYSIGAWIGALGGITGFFLFAGRSHYRLLVPLLVIIIGAILVTVFPSEISAQVQRVFEPTELSLRSGAWQTAVRVITAFPWTGIGLGLTNYLQNAEPYRVPAQYLPLAHPHNSYLEWGAMAGLPVLMLFLALLLFALEQARRNWMAGDKGTRCLLSGGIAAVMALSVNSLSINGWTLPPLAAIGWLVLGAIASPLITSKGSDEMEETKAQGVC